MRWRTTMNRLPMFLRAVSLAVAMALPVGCVGWEPFPTRHPDPEGNVRVSCIEAAPLPTPCSSEAYRACSGPASVIGSPSPTTLGVGNEPKSYQYGATYHCD